MNVSGGGSHVAVSRSKVECGVSALVRDGRFGWVIPFLVLCFKFASFEFWFGDLGSLG